MKKVVFQYDIHFLQSRSLSSRLFSAEPGTTAAQAAEPVDQLSRLIARSLHLTACQSVLEQGTGSLTAPGEQVMALHGSSAAIGV